ncbi:hypothetical protein ILUMI_22365 [Ignelater luminosus]|uniref:DUF7869 domain-containing protein n=1 Tax=Ignelater luminosus TaxID=2038154 RepID=A0A8K0CAQ8_IGNLU|nr:hypothetical protein ILUMI_22365 [Ignelater luminosus]
MAGTSGMSVKRKLVYSEEQNNASNVSGEYYDSDIDKDYSNHSSDSEESTSVLYVQTTKMDAVLIKKYLQLVQQSKKYVLMALWLPLVRDNVYKSIEHRFLVLGHTHLPSERDFATIEKHKKYMEQIYTPEQWIEDVGNSKKKSAFIVTQMAQNDFFSFEEIIKSIQKKQLTEEKENTHFASIQCNEAIKRCSC